MRHRVFLVAGAALVVVVTASGAARAAVGDLSNPSCVKEAVPEECASAAQGLDGAYSVVVSPDRRSVYVASYVDDAIVRFDRNTSTGALGNASCVDDTLLAQCTSSTEGLGGAVSVAASSDGRSVYVVSNFDDAIVRFDRSTSTGALSNPTCIEDSPAGECDPAASGLDRASGVAVSPDGVSVYVASEDDDAIVRFTRDATTGALSNPSCIEDSATSECGAATQGLEGATAVAVSPDGRSVYAASRVDNAIVRFDRNLTTGALSNPSCIKDTAPGECGSAAAGLDGPRSLAVSPDGRSVYVASTNANAIVRFDRDASTGALSDPTCIDDPVPGECATSADGLRGARSVTVSPDGRSVYVASGLDNAIVRFDRNASTGALSRPGCVKDAESFPNECGAAADGLEGPASVAVSPDGGSLYAASDPDNAIVRFDREIAATVAPPPAPSAPRADTTRPETTITKGPRRKVRTKRKKARARFRFSSSEAAASFECSLDDAGFDACTSPFKVKVKKGRHGFEVRATDAAGNVDATPASRTWKVKRKR
jgi:DNA-binding beta-propeller fold protein YncE